MIGPWADGQCKSREGLVNSRLYYLLKYPPSTSVIDLVNAKADMDPHLPVTGIGYDNAERTRSSEKSRLQIAGAFVFCPMVAGKVLDGQAYDSVEEFSPLAHHRTDRSCTCRRCWDVTACEGYPWEGV
jgi:hypothetical protein